MRCASEVAKQSPWQWNYVERPAIDLTRLVPRPGQSTARAAPQTMSNTAENISEQAEAFQKIWTESFTKLIQAASVFTPNSAPPELLREIRSGILNALAKSWDEFLRSPQFQESMKQWMDRAVAFRKTTQDIMTRARKEMQAPSSSDIDAIMLSVRHMETRILNRLEALEQQFKAAGNGSGRSTAKKRNATSARRPSSHRASSRKASRNK
jgi:hypothetical protein